MIIPTDRLILRQWHVSDIPVLAAINQDPTVMEFFPAPKTYAETEAFVLANIQLYDKNEYSIFAVELKESHALIGFVGLQQVGKEMPFAPAVEILWRFDNNFWGCGYAYEAAKAIVDYAFKELGITELVSFTVPDNLRSRKLMERLGFVQEPEGDFSHPKIASDHKFSRHVLYRLTR